MRARRLPLTTRELMATRILLALIVGLLALPLAPALAGCPPDERPCGGTTGTTTTAPSAPTAVPQPEPTPDNVMINVPAPTSPPSTQPSSCYDFPAPSFSLPHDGAGRLITTGMLWETVRDTLPGQSEWVNYHTDWPNFGDPCSTLYGKGVQDKTDLESFLAYLNSLAAQSNQSNNQEEPTAQPTTAPAPTATAKTIIPAESAACTAAKKAKEDADAAEVTARANYNAADTNYWRAWGDLNKANSEQAGFITQRDQLQANLGNMSASQRLDALALIAGLQAKIDLYNSTIIPAKKLAVHEAQIARDQALGILNAAVAAQTRANDEVNKQCSVARAA